MFKFTQKRYIRRAFAEIAGSDKLIDYQEWKHALGVKNDLLCRRMFVLTDSDHSGYIDLKEFQTFALTLLKQGSDERLRFVFKVCDQDDNGLVGREELQDLIRASLQEQSLKLAPEKLEDLLDCFYAQASVKRKSGMYEDEFVAMLAAAPAVDRQFDGFIHKLLGIAVKRESKKVKGASGGTRLRRFFRSEWKSWFWLLAYLAANAVLFGNALLHYRELGANLAVQIARGGGACLNMNCALVLLPMCRALATGLRHTIFARVLPLDNLTEIHKLIGFTIVGFSLVHTGAHFYNYWLSGLNIAEQLLFTLVGATGLGLLVALLLMTHTALERKNHYQAFVYTHLLYGAFLAALLWHGPVFWIWLSPVLLLFALDASYRMFFKYRRVEITELRALSDRVTQVRFKRGTLFAFKPGDYIKIRIPSVSRLQWHPFTLSAAPQSQRLDVHVRNNGDWSGALHNLAGMDHPQRKKWTAYIDGPYGAPTSSIYRSKVAVLISGGIGVTPFASVLQSLLLKEKAGNGEAQNSQLIYFHWLNRSQSSYEWFIDLLQKAEQQLGEARFHLNIHLTSLAKNMSNLVMQLAFDAYFEKHGRDPITDLSARTSAGRPNWDLIFAKLAENHRGERVDIYFCGPKALGKSVQKMAAKHGLYYNEEKFE